MTEFTEKPQHQETMIRQNEYQRRRRQLMKMAGEDSVVIVPAAPAQIRNNDVHYPYRQDSDFLYLSGFREPDAMLILMPDGGEGYSTMFCRARDPERERWDGAMIGVDGAVEHYGMDEAFNIDELEAAAARSDQ